MVGNLEFFSFYVLNSGKCLFHNVVAYWLAVLFLAGEKNLLKVEKTLNFFKCSCSDFRVVTCD